MGIAAATAVDYALPPSQVSDEALRWDLHPWDSIGVCSLMSFKASEESQVNMAALIFVLSGAAALVYQVAWQRILALHSGVGLYSITMIVAAFMAGLGLGSHLGGVLSGRIGKRSALRVFAVLELAVGLFGAMSPVVYYDWLYPFASRLPSPSWRGGMLHFVALLFPTVLMGMSLPILVRAVVANVGRAGRTIGYLYGLNLIGAAVGAAAGTWILMPLWGVRGAVVVGAVANMTAGLAAWLLTRRADAALAEPPAGVAAEVEAPGGRPLGLWLALYALSGFTALSLEILWFRIVDVAVKSTAFTFGTVLGLYLLGNAVGCLYAARRSGAVSRPLRVFLVLQCGLLAYSALIIVVFSQLSPKVGPLTWFVDYWSGYAFFPLGHQWAPGAILLLYVVLPLGLFGVPTVLMGFAFPILQRAVQDNARTSGRKVGFLQAANIAGCVAGTLVIGLWGLNTLGTAGSFRVLLGCGLVFAAIGVVHYGRSFLVAAVVLILLIVGFPGQDAMWRRFHGLSGSRKALFREDATSLAAVTPEQGGRSRRWRLSINGKGNSWFPFGGVHTILGALPAAVHAVPRDVAVIGLGSGNTVWAAACRRETLAVTVFELSAPQPELLRRLLRVDALPDLQHLMEDSRVRVVVADGRQALAASDVRYDLIEADATWPESAYSGNLYSVEFFALCSARLKPGGVMCTWAPTLRIRASFQEAFKFVLAVGDGDILIGSNELIPLDPARWTTQLRQAADYLGPVQFQEVATTLSRLRVLTPGARSDEDMNHDLFPRDEFASRQRTPWRP